MLMIEYKENIEISFLRLKALFAAVGWLNGDKPEKLKKAITNSSTVITAWDGDKLIGLVNAIDDTELAVYVNYVLVNPKYQGQGIGTNLITRLKKKYKDFLYILLLVGENKTIEFYTKCGFEKVELIPMMSKNY